MTNFKNISAAALILAAGLPAASQAPKISGLIQGWYTQMMDNNLRSNSAAFPYYGVSPHNENGFYFKRIDLKATGSFGNVDYEVFVDPTSANNPILQDGYLKYRAPYNIEVKVGQFKTLQTQEANSSSADLMLAERSMLARVFGDVRDRGVLASIGFGDPKALGGRLTAGVFNGSAKGNDVNAQKDYVARLDMNFGKEHTFGAYTMQASTNVIDNSSTSLYTFPVYGNGNAPTPAEVRDNKDATSNMGAFYRFQTDKYHAAVEFITGTLGRRFPSLGTSGSRREHLDQQFMGYVATFGYAVSNKHSFVLRYDSLNYNSGDKWYGDGNPYLKDGGDYKPVYTETTVGYTYALAEHYRQACVRVNYIMRSKNFLTPRTSAGQTGPQGGDSLVIAFQVGF
jgi:hypothetical protein